MNALAILAAAVPFLGPQDEDFDGNKLVRVSVVADRAAVEPGGTITLAVRYAIEKRWHIYWENPGDSGMRTRATLTLPAGWKAGEPRYPYPERYLAPGDIESFVFHDELVLLVDVTAPADAQPGTRAKLDVQGDWLVCKEVCVPGAGQAALEIEVAAASRPANEKLFEAARARVPKPWTELAKARTTWGGTREEPRLTVIVPGATKLDWFPLDVEPVELQSATVDVGKQGATLRATYAFTQREERDEPRVRGVLVVTTAAGTAAYRLDHLYTPPPAGQ
jgi:thiol:disulfide interchange protein DsbD